jgi:CHAT domain-containing protein
LQLELQRCLELLAKAAMQSLIAWLFKRGATSLTLIPCGTLAALPLAAVKLADGRTVGETLPTSTAISARSLLHDKHEVRKRAGVYAFGDPRPTGQELQWGEAEAHTLVKLAHSVGLPGEARVHNKAVRSWLIQVLRTGCIVDASCHGAFDANDFLQSSLQLARGKRLTLAEALNREVDLRGLRLLILSACQTAILDLRGARDEVRSLAAGMIQAGAQAVLGSLWPVDDKATYLLIVRFAQEWLPRMEQEPPAAALARAHHWLRTVTNRELQQWHTIDIPMPTVWERREAGSVMPERDPWVDEEKTPPLGVTKLAEVRGRGDRYDIQESESLVRIEGINVDNLDARPYADPIYWAGFQIIGW